jgi:hypothetical protein
MMIMPLIGGYFSGVADGSSLAIDTQGGHGQTGRVASDDLTKNPVTVLGSSSSTIDAVKKGDRHGGARISGSAPEEGTRTTCPAEIAIGAKESTL